MSTADPSAPVSQILRDPKRLAALKATGLYDAPPSAALDRLTRLTSRLLRAPIASVTLVGTDKQFFSSCVGIGDPWATERGTPLSHSFCQYVVGSGEPLVVTDARLHPLLKHNGAVPDLGVIAYAGMPLVDLGGHVLGSFCVIDTEPHEWSADDLATLEELARVAMAEITLGSAMRTLGATSHALSEMLDTTTELVCASDADGVITFANRAWREAFGYDSVVDVRAIDLVVPEHQGRYIETARRLMQGESVEDFEAVLVARDGRRVVCRGRGSAEMVDDASSPTGKRCIGTRAVYRDVTAERQAEADRARLIATFEATSDFVGTATSDGRVDFLNRAGRRLLGIGDDIEPTALRTSDFLPPATLALLVETGYPVAVHDGAWSGEGELRSVHGDVIPVAISVVSHPSLVPGEPPYFSSIMRDLREREREEAELRAAHAAQSTSERELRALFGAMHDDVFVIDRHGVYVRVIPTAQQAMASEALALQGLRMHDVLAAEVAVELLAVVHAALEAGSAVDHDYAIELPNGTAWFSATVSPLADDTVLWVARDVTARYRAERELRLAEGRFREALDNSLDGFYALKAVRGARGTIVDFEILEANGRAAAMADLQPEDLVGQLICELFPLQRVDGNFDKWVEVVESGVGAEWENESSDPRVVARWLYRQAVPLADGVAITVRDISARKRAERELSLLVDVTHALAVIEGLEDGSRTVLEAMCDAAGWEYGEAWLVEPSDDGSESVLRHGPVWHRRGDVRLSRFDALSESYTFRHGEGMVGRAWAEHATIRLRDLRSADANVGRAALARDAGLRDAVAVPLLADGKVVAVLAFHTRDPYALDDARVELLTAVAAQAGGAVRRKLAEDALARERTFLASVLDSLSEGVSVCDANGRLTLFNRAMLDYHGLPADRELPPEKWSEHYSVYQPDGVTLLPADEQPHLRALREQCDIEGIEYVIAPPGRPKRTMVASAHLLIGPNGKCVGVVCAARDLTAQKEAETALRDSEARYRALVDTSPDAVLVHHSGRIRYANDAANVLVGAGAHSLIGRRVLDLVHEDDRAAVMERFRGVAEGVSPDVRETRLTHVGDGHVVYAEIAAAPVRFTDADGVHDAVQVVFRDVSARRAAQAELRESEARFRGVLETVRSIALTLDVDGRVTFANDALVSITGFTRDEIVGQDWYDRFVPAGHDIGAKYYDVVMRDDISSHDEHEIVTRTGERRLITWDNTVLRDATGRAIGTASLGHDITERRALEARLELLSEHDELTTLLNRRGFRRMAEQELRVDNRLRRRGALLYIDLDGFKPINDTYGHAAGDLALRFVADVLRATVREADLVARLGGDEFAVMATELGDAGDDGGEVLATRIRETLATHNAAARAAGRSFDVRFSIGVATHRPGDDLDTLLARADAALYEVKHVVRGALAGRA